MANAPARFRAWGAAGPLVLVLVRGGGAHSPWWDYIGPLLATLRRVVALDLTGHGDSGRRPEYSRACWAEGSSPWPTPAAPAPVVVGHSMGGPSHSRRRGFSARSWAAR
ncbi:alpha/beta fold hydrolase [Pseudonocardia kunmingensis]|uniref:alpha/beta fold hydrolase n=1 Tax=Pseudonocardia kunmingensis TaxID=630975 RepID=UPI00147907E9|nr:alpha/beta fold hydrolase [Pseudonocardia kunmingensis]